MAAWPGSFDELGGEALHPPVDGDVINGDTALGQQFLNVPLREAVPQVPADRDGDHLPREPETSEHRRRARRRHRTSLPPAAIDQRNRALRCQRHLNTDLGAASHQHPHEHQDHQEWISEYRSAPLNTSAANAGAITLRHEASACSMYLGRPTAGRL